MLLFFIIPFIDLDLSRVKDVTSILLDLIRWNGNKKELQIYSMTTRSWRTIARNLGLEVKTPGCIDNIARLSLLRKNLKDLQVEQLLIVMNPVSTASWIMLHAM